MKRLLLLLILCCLTVTVIAQEFPNNGISLHISYAFEIPIALSYERYFDTGKVIWSLGTGLTLLIPVFFFEELLIEPHISTSIIFGRAQNHFEAKAALCFWPEILPVINIAYRYQKPNSPLFFRASVGIISGIGIAIGYAF